MQYGQSLIDKAAQICGSYYKLSKRINVPESNLSCVRKGTRRVPLDWALDLAEITGDDPGEVLKLLTMERTKNPEKRTRLGKLVAVGAVAMLLFSYGNDSLSRPVTYSPLHQPLENNSIVSTSYCFTRRIVRRCVSVFRTRWLAWFVVPKQRTRTAFWRACPVQRQDVTPLVNSKRMALA